MNSVYFDPAVGGDGSTVTDGADANGLAGPTGRGYKTKMVPAFSNVVNIAGFVADTAADVAADAAAATNASNVNGTSNTNRVAIGTGSKVLTYVESGRSVVAGMWIQATDAANTANYIHGQATSYVGNVLTINSTTTGGSGTPSSWVISLSGPRGPAGAGSGDVTGPASSVNNRVVIFSGTSGKVIADSGLTLAGTNTGDETATTFGALINGATAKTTPVDADMFALMDSAASNIVKKLSWANLKATLFTAWGALVAAATAKTTPTGADEFAIADSAASSATKRLSLTNLAAWILNGPALGNTNLTGTKHIVPNSQPTTSATTGATTVDWSASRVVRQAEPTGDITYTFTAPGVSNVHLQLYIESDGTSTARNFTWPGTVIWYGSTLAATTTNKKAIVNLYWDGTFYHAMGVSQV